jgi:hypothetical protein
MKMTLNPQLKGALEKRKKESRRTGKWGNGFPHTVGIYPAPLVRLLLKSNTGIRNLSSVEQ